jgi:hypothetical protein
MRLSSQTPAPEPAPEPAPIPEESVPQETGAVGAHRACPVCHQVFPERMMSFYGERLLCKTCCHQAEVDAAQPKRRSHFLATICTWGIVLTLLATGFYFGVRYLASFVKSKEKTKAPVVQASQDQAAKGPVFSMAIAPSEGSTVPEGWQLGPNACLVERNDSSIICVTGVAKRQTLGAASAPSASKNLKSFPQPANWSFEDISRVLSACRLTGSDGSATFTKLLPEARGAFERGVVVFGEPSGVVPKNWIRLQMRVSAYDSGVQMTVLARDPKTGARVPLEAMVASSNLSDVATLTADQVQRISRRSSAASESLLILSQPNSADELIGAPVIDPGGQLAAVITCALAPTDQSGRATEFIAYGMHALKSLTISTPKHK